MDYGDIDDENDYGYYADEYYSGEDFDPYEYTADVEEHRTLQDEFGAYERAAPLMQDPWLEKFQNACENEWKEFRLPENIIIALKQGGSDFVKTLNPLALSVAYWMLYDVSGTIPKLVSRKTQYSINPKILEKVKQVESKKRISPASLMRYVRFWWDYFGVNIIDVPKEKKDLGEDIPEDEQYWHIGNDEGSDYDTDDELETKTDEPHGDDFDSERGFVRLEPDSFTGEQIVNIKNLETKDEETDDSDFEPIE